MPKIGNLRLFTLQIVVLIVIALSSKAVAQQVAVNALVSETNPYKGERIVLTVEISGDNFRSIELPKLPTLSGLQYMSVSPNTSQSFSIINGVTSRKYSYSYYLQTLDVGDFTVSPIIVVIDGKEYSTNPVNIKVLDRNSAASRETAESMRDIFLRIEVSDRNPYVNQQILANVVLFFKQSTEVLSYQPNPSWKAEGFWKEDLDDGQEARTESVVIDGVRYRKATLMQYALFPSKSGRLTISPYQVAFNVRVPPSANQPFAGWGGFGSSQRTIDLSSEAVTVTVRDLPSGAVGTSLGAVGQFEIRRRISKTDVLVGEAIELTTDISGVGNIALVSRPNYSFPEGFEVYEPETQSNINRSGSRVNGNKLVKDVFIPRRAGEFVIPELTVSWYNDRTNSWQSTRLAAITIRAERDPNAVNIASQTSISSGQILTGLAVWSLADTTPISGYIWFWIGLLSPFLVFGTGYTFMKYTNKMNTDIAFSRSKKAASAAEKWFTSAATFAAAGDIKAGYGNIHKGLAGFIGDRLNLPPAGLSDDAYFEALQKSKLDDAIAKQIFDLLNTCSTIRYAPVTDQATFEIDLKKAREFVTQLRKSI
jgi:hypothetical protein